MKVLLLPGYGKHNKQEMESISRTLRAHSYDVITHEWRHWKNDDDGWDMSFEVNEIVKKIADLPDVKYIVVAKSIGTLVALNVVDRLLKHFSRLIFMGIPLESRSVDEKKKYIDTLTSFGSPITVIQNSRDHHGSAESIQQFLEKVPCNMLIKDAEGHGYDYPEEILRIIENSLLTL